MAVDETVLSLFARRVAEDGEKTAIHFKRGGRFYPISWNDLARQVRQVAAGLVREGLQPGDRVIQVSENRYEWIVCDLAIQMAQAIHVPVHAPLTGEQIAFQINNSGATIVLLSGLEQAKKLIPQCEQLSKNLKIFAFDPCPSNIGEQPVKPLDELTNDVNVEGIEQRAIKNTTPDSLATILYTSGTTGEPKGVVLNQRNLTSNALTILEAFTQKAEDLRLSFLPFSHIFARTCDVYTWIATGSELALAESRETVLEDCAMIHPTMLNGVPYFFDRVRRYLIDQGRADETGSLRELLGGRMRLCCSGGAALPVHVFDFYEQHGMPILQGYGLTETSPVITASSESRNRRGCVGPPIPGVEVKIAPDGEILTRGPHVMVGYYNNQKATDEVIKDGWFHTGDLGELDSEGLLKITGRKKEIIVTSGGKNVAPVMLEALLTEDPLIVQALVIGDGRDYLTALIVPDPDNLKAEILAQKISVMSRAGALTHPDVFALYESRIQQRLASVSHYEQIRKFKLMDRGFTIESGELTPKLSLRRKVIEANCAELIEEMYRK